MYTTYDIFDELLGTKNWFNNFFTEAPQTRRVLDYPSINLYENDDELELKILVPGVNVENLDLQLVDNSLKIEGEKKSDYMEKPYTRKERRFGKFQKLMKLPYKVDPNHIEANMKDGVLTVKLTKSEEMKIKKIEIN